eukprot:jgi/Ulvmu1/7992/UM004_0227.1
MRQVQEAVHHANLKRAVLRLLRWSCHKGTTHIVTTCEHPGVAGTWSTPWFLRVSLKIARIPSSCQNLLALIIFQWSWCWTRAPVSAFCLPWSRGQYRVRGSEDSSYMDMIHAVSLSRVNLISPINHTNMDLAHVCTPA